MLQRHPIRLSCIALLALSSAAEAQLNDDFSDGDLTTGTVWNGSTALFAVVDDVQLPFAVGQFRGRNLFGDLPEKSARNSQDWVLKDGDAAIWVTGKAPRGDGWKLDLEYKGDSKTWLEVTGKPEVMNGIVYLKASRVIPTKAPGSERRGPEPR